MRLALAVLTLAGCSDNQSAIAGSAVPAEALAQFREELFPVLDALDPLCPLGEEFAGSFDQEAARLRTTEARVQQTPFAPVVVVSREALDGRGVPECLTPGSPDEGKRVADQQRRLDQHMDRIDLILDRYLKGGK